ncbi:Endoplasmic reticulum-Golgi intermediate compartment protein 3 [Linum grandiflorum]
MDGMMSKLRSLDAYPKINEDFYSRTLSGGLITLASSVVMLLLFISELRLYLHTVTETKLVVDTSRGETLRINVTYFFKKRTFSYSELFDVSFPALPCSILSIDAMDISGEQHLDVKHDIIKKRLDSHGNVIEARPDGIGAPKIEKPLQKHGGRLDHNETYCGSCFGAEESDDHCCNSCEDVREAYRKKGWALSNPDLIDQVSHHINSLSFGESFPGVVNPLDGVVWTQESPSGMYQYFIKVVPTVYTDVSGHTIQSNQFSVTEHFRSADAGRLQSLPGVFFFYDLSPIKVTFMEEHVSFLHFLTNMCAIVGGVFTVSGILDSFVYHSQKAIKKKMELGKFS